MRGGRVTCAHAIGTLERFDAYNTRRIENKFKVETVKRSRKNKNANQRHTHRGRGDGPRCGQKWKGDDRTGERRCKDARVRMEQANNGEGSRKRRRGPRRCTGSGSLLYSDAVYI